MILDNAFMLGINWLISLIEDLTSTWEVLAEPYFSIGDLEVSFLGVFSIGFIGVVLTFKMIDFVNPIG